MTFLLRSAFQNRPVRLDLGKAALCPRQISLRLAAASREVEALNKTYLYIWDDRFLYAGPGFAYGPRAATRLYTIEGPTVTRERGQRR